MVATGSLASISKSVPRWLIGPLIPAVVAGVLGLWGIGDKSLWLDETFSAAVARLPTLDLAVYLARNELHAAPYYLLLNAWTFLGTGEAQLRLLSVVIGIVGVVATYFVGKRYGVGFAAALLLALAPLFVQFEQNVRGYSLLVAWASIATLAYLRYREQRTRSRAAIYVGAAAAMIYVHPIGGFVIVAHAIWEFLEAPRDKRARPLLLFVPIVVAWLPMIRFMAAHRDKISWIPPLSAGTVSDALFVLGGGALAAGAITVLLVLRAKRDLPMLWLLVPVIGTLAVSAFIQPLLQARYLIVVLPAGAIIVARNRRVALVALAALLLVGNVAWYTSPAREDWRSADAWVRAAIAPGDGAVFAPSYARLAIEYYGEFGDSLYPPVAWDGLYLPGLVPPGGIPAEFSSARIWLIETHGPPMPAPVLAAMAPYEAAAVRDFGPDGPRVTLLLRTSTP